MAVEITINEDNEINENIEEFRKRWSSIPDNKSIEEIQLQHLEIDSNVNNTTSINDHEDIIHNF